MKFPFITALLSGLISIYCLADEALPNVSKGKIERIEAFQSAYVSERHIDVWLPPGYTTSLKYDVLYMHDGRMLFDAKTTWNKQEWRIDEVAGQLIEQKQVRPFIVVAIPNAGPSRHSEFFPQQPFEALPKATQQAMYQLKRAPQIKLFEQKVYSDNYGQFIVKELIPYIESNFSVNKGHKYRYLAGSSMGGLISWYTLMNYPNEFAGAICMSTHWPGTFSAGDPAFAMFKAFIDNNLSKLSAHKIYFDHGDKTLDAMYPALQQQIDKVFDKHNYPKQQWRSLFYPGESHTENSWAKRVSVPLKFMFSAPSQSNTNSNN